MDILPKSVMRSINEFSKLPGIGPKTASRLTFYLLNCPQEEVTQFGTILHDLKKNSQVCKNCFMISEDELCPLCSDNSRDIGLLMVVAEPLDIVALERTGYKGYYHVLGGVISPIDGIGPENLTIEQLLGRIKGSSDQIKELILATNPSLEGEATALYIAHTIDNLKLKGEIKNNFLVSRIARGLPVGGDVEYADEMTLTRALEGRKSV